MVVRDLKICGGVPTIKGTRIPISLILANIKDEVCFDDICKDYNISLDDIKDSIEYVIKQIDE